MIRRTLQSTARVASRRRGGPTSSGGITGGTERSPLLLQQPVHSSRAGGSSFRRDFFLRERVRLFSASPKTQIDDVAVASTRDSTVAVLPFYGESTKAVQEAATKPNKKGKSKGVASSEDPSSGDSNMDKLLEGLSSRPVAGGNWKPHDPVGWATEFGSRSAEQNESLQAVINVGPAEEGYHEVDPNQKYHGVTMVRTKEQARIVVEKLVAADPTIFHACDTEVMAIDLKKVGPVGNGYVTCISIYSGPDFDYGLGEEPGSVLWVDNLDDACGVLQEFKGWFEDEKYLKVWHNYGFDRHIMWNEGIMVKGFGGDTMHMARLQDTARSRSGNGNGYGLAALTTELLKGTDEAEASKVSMKELFGVPRIRKDGSEGSLVDIPPVEVMQRDPRHREKWIEYSCKDAKGTWLIREKLEAKLKKMMWFEDKNLFDYYFLHMRPFGEVLTDMERRGVRVNARDYLAGVERQARLDRTRHSLAFRTWAQTQIGADGLAMNPASSTQLQTFLFGGSQNQKNREYTEPIRVFKVPRGDISEDALEAYKQREMTGERDPEPETDELDHMTAVQLKALCKEQGLKVAGKKDELKERIRDHFLTSAENAKAAVDDGLGDMTDDDLRDALVARGMNRKGDRKVLLERLRTDISYASEMLETSSPNDREGYMVLSEALEAASRQDGSTLAEILAEVKKKTTAEPKYIDLKITTLGLEPFKYTAGGAPSVTADVLRTLAGDPFADPPKYGKAYDAFLGGERGHDACVALFSLCSIGSIDTMIANFLTSLQSLADEASRVHCSLNLNTETGRLSSRRPNLQNQPALEKDTYKIRQAFEASKGNNLIVADYGQLELRLLASMTDCRSMIDAFEAGGDFHSRTALDMFDYVKEKVDNGDCLLEWDYEKGDAPKPLLKDLFASERRKAKTLNFSIAYGKTAHGLSEDWGVSRREAEDMLQAWYDARPEVASWQADKKKTAREKGFTRTLMGRYRQLPEAMGTNRKFIGHAERASINTPIQGGAADVAMMAMNLINKSETLERLGWILLLQVHDEVMLEGPEETSEEAFTEVLRCMQEPWTLGLPKTSVPLLVDGSCKHKNWYDAK